ncbi:hypothetical protein, partial [Corynebacterium heidelbergense]
MYQWLRLNYHRYRDLRTSSHQRMRRSQESQDKLLQRRPALLLRPQRSLVCLHCLLCPPYP